MKAKQKALLLVFAALFFLAALAVLPRLTGQTGSQFNLNVEEDQFSLEFFPLNGTQARAFPLQAGDRIQVNLELLSGSLQISIGQEGKPPVYEGKDPDLHSFQVNIPEDGTYLFSVTGKAAEGRISFQNAKGD